MSNEINISLFKFNKNNESDSKIDINNDSKNNFKDINTVLLKLKSIKNNESDLKIDANNESNNDSA